MIVLPLALHESVETNQNQSHEKWLHPTKNKANIPHSSTKSQTQKIKKKNKIPNTKKLKKGKKEKKKKVLQKSVKYNWEL